MSSSYESKQNCRRTTSESLPEEVLERIFIILSRSDALSCARTCRRWARIVCRSHMLEDSQLVVRGPSKMEYLENILVNSERKYRRLKIHCVRKLEYNPRFWEKIGSDLRHLEIVDCVLTIEVLHRVLRQCPKLESLDFNGAVARAAPTSSRKLSEDRPCLLNLRILSLTNHLNCCFCTPNDHISDEARLACKKLSDQPELYLSADDLVELMLKLSPNTTSFSMRNWTDRFHRGMPHSLRNLKQSIVKLDFTGPCIEDEGMIQILDLYCTSLRELTLNCCWLLTQRTWSTIPKCTGLQRLSIENVLFGGNQVKEIILNCSNLETLELGGSDMNFTDASLKDMHRLQHLRRLVWSCERSREVVSVIGMISTLQHLDMLYCDIAIFREIATLKDLRSLVLRSTDIETPECFDVICNNFRKLRRLRVRCSDKLTNADGAKLNLLEKLEHLQISGPAKFTDLTSNGDVCLSALKTLIVSDDVITAMAMPNYAARHPHLENLFIFSSKTLTDDALISILGSEPRLRRLGLHLCPRLTDRSLRALGNLCPQLRCLSVDECRGTTDRGLSYILEARPLVEYSPEALSLLLFFEAHYNS